jgi:alpha-tubulin suppressor-like RCC1 family protein
MGDALAPVNLGAGKTAAAISATGSHTCALLNDGTIKCWGSNDSGQLGQGDAEDRGDEPREMGDALAPVDVGAGKIATSVSAAGGYTCALLNDGCAKCWGRNERGQLGLGDRANRGDEPGEMGDALPAVKLFSALW